MRSATNKVLRSAIALLTFGFLVNVTVAWGCSLWVDLSAAKTTTGRTIGDQTWWLVSQKNKWGSAIFRSSASILPETHDDSRVRPVANSAELLLPCFGDLHRHRWETRGGVQSSSRGLMACGWPCLSLWCESRPEGQVYGPCKFKVTGGVVLPLSHRIWGCCSYPRVLPLNVAWPGFILNTIFYAAVCWLLFAAPFAVRRAIRRRHNRCLRCNYDLRGHHHGQDRCPECGTFPDVQRNPHES
jgi:hypothetical protein